MKATWKKQQLWSWTTGLFVGTALFATSAQAISPPRMLTKKEIQEYTHLVLTGKIVEKKVVEHKPTNDIDTTVWLQISDVDVKNKKYAGFLKKGRLLRFYSSCQTKPVKHKPVKMKPRWVKGPDGRKVLLSPPRRIPFWRHKRRCVTFYQSGGAPLMKKKGSVIKLPMHVAMYSTKAEFTTVPLVSAWGGPLRGVIVKTIDKK